MPVDLVSEFDINPGVAWKKIVIFQSTYFYHLQTVKKLLKDIGNKE